MVSERPFLMDYMFICQMGCEGEGIATEGESEYVIACHNNKHTARIAVDEKGVNKTLLEFLQEKLQNQFTVCLREIRRGAEG